ncbi:MAG: hypothetical protein ABSE73_17345 [Planctomycetota bacterium]
MEQRAIAGAADRGCFLSALVIGWEVGYCTYMSAVELLKLVEALPARERQKFLSGVLMLAEGTPAHPRRTAMRMKWPDVEARAKRIFGARVLPNLLSLERK